MAVTLAGGCRVTEMYEGDAIVKGTARIWNQIGRATGAQAISLQVMEFSPGQSPAIQNGDCDQILYLLQPGNSTRIADDEVSAARVSGSVNLLIDGVAHAVDPDTGIYIRPHQTFAVDHAAASSIVIISSQCPDPDSPPAFLDRVRPSSETATGNRKPIVRLADRRAQTTADRWYRVLVDDEVGSKQVTQFVGSIPPGRAPDHFHNYEEVLFILRGAGRMWAGESNTPIATGSCIYLPKGQVHCVENTGVGELRLLGIFYPAGSPSVRYDS